MQEVARQLQLSERMLALAAAVSIDFDYFSRHSSGGGGMLPFFLPIPMPSPPYVPPALAIRSSAHSSLWPASLPAPQVYSCFMRPSQCEQAKATQHAHDLGRPHLPLSQHMRDKHHDGCC